jgi:hypothetical protein
MTARKILNAKKFKRIMKKEDSVIGSVIAYGQFDIKFHPAVVYREWVYVKTYIETKGERLIPCFSRFKLQDLENSIKSNAFGFVFSRRLYV